MTPLLIFGFQVPAATAIGSDVMSAVLMKMVGGYQHYRQQTVDVQLVKWLAIGSVPGSLFGIGLLHRIRAAQVENLNQLLMHGVGAAILLVAIVALGGRVLRWIDPDLSLPTLPQLDLSTASGRVATVLLAALLGCLLGVTSVGSGSLFAIVLIGCFRLDSHKLVGTDIAHAAILLLFTAVGHVGLGTVDLGLVLPIWLGTVPGVLFGAQLCRVIHQGMLRTGLYVLLVAIGWQLVSHA